MSDSPSEPSAEDVRGARLRNDGERAAFERVDWDEIRGWRRWLSAERVVLVVGLFAVADLYNYHRLSGETYLVMRWNVGREDWLALCSLVVFLAYVVVPLAKAPGRTRRLLGRLWGRWGTVVSLLFIVGVFLVGVWTLVTGYQSLLPWQEGIYRFQPPVGFSAPKASMDNCLGTITGEFRSKTCHGTRTYPLGTDRSGYPMSELLVMGTRPVVYAVVVTLGLIVPLATVVGVVAGYYGGLVDDLLMAYVDLQLSVPAMLVYLVVYMFILNSMFVFLVAFGLLSWGGIARIVRSETLQRREEGYVLTARATGASGPSIIRRHVVPNVSNSVVPAAFHLIALVVITEAGLSFLEFNPIDQSWGYGIARGKSRPVSAWWVAGLPATALAFTVVSLKVIGDGLRDVLDPRGDR